MINDLSFCVSGGDETISGEIIEKAYALNYNNIFTFGICALQELDKEVQEEKTKVSTLETQYNTLETQYNTLETQYNTLETQYNTLQSQYNDLLSRVSALENSS